MIHYSIIPAEIVFGNNDGSDLGKFLEIEYQGERVQVLPLTNNRYEVNRIISTSPKAFLNPDLQPGSIIEGGFVPDRI